MTKAELRMIATQLSATGINSRSTNAQIIEAIIKKQEESNG